MISSSDTCAGVANVVALTSLLLIGSCGPKSSKPAWHKELSQARSKVEKLGNEARLTQWVQFADQLRGRVLNKLLVVEGPGKGRLILRIDDRAYHATLEDPIKWEETVPSEESAFLTNEIQSLRKELRDMGLVGFERSANREIVYLYVEQNVLLVVLPDLGATQAQQTFERFAQKGQDPRGDVVIKISPRVFGKT